MTISFQSPLWPFGNVADGTEEEWYNLWNGYAGATNFVKSITGGQPLPIVQYGSGGTPTDTSITRGRLRLRGNTAKRARQYMNTITQDTDSGESSSSTDDELFHKTRPPALASENINDKQSTMNKRALGEEEIPVVQPPKRIARILADYTTIQLNLYASQVLVGTYASNVYSAGLRIKMNSIITPFNWATTFKYMGTEQWVALYQYYRVLSNDITINVKNITSASDWAGDEDDYDYSGVTVSMEPTDSATALLTTERAMYEGKHNVTTTLHPGIISANTGDVPIGHAFKNQHTFKHHYEPGQFIMANSHVTNQAEDDRWTSVSSSPSHLHYLHLQIAPAYADSDPAITDGVKSKVVVQVHCTATIQWREVASGILTDPQTTA